MIAVLAVSTGSPCVWANRDSQEESKRILANVARMAKAQGSHQYGINNTQDVRKELQDTQDEIPEKYFMERLVQDTEKYFDDVRFDSVMEQSNLKDIDRRENIFKCIIDRVRSYALDKLTDQNKKLFQTMQDSFGELIVSNPKNINMKAAESFKKALYGLIMPGITKTPEADVDAVLRNDPQQFCQVIMAPKILTPSEIRHCANFLTPDVIEAGHTNKVIAKLKNIFK